jgi:hypothetical protein
MEAKRKGEILGVLGRLGDLGAIDARCEETSTGVARTHAICTWHTCMQAHKSVCVCVRAYAYVVVSACMRVMMHAHTQV